MAAYTRCLRCAGAPRRPASGSELSLLIPSWHAVLSDHGESDIDIFQNFDADIGLRRMTTGSALPTLPQSVPRGRSISWLHWFASATACQVACPPVRIRLGRPAFGDFYFQAFNGSVSLPVAGYNYNSDWTLCWRDSHPLEWQLASLHGHSRPSRPARNATYDRSCLKADIRRAPTRLVLEIEIHERLPGAVADDEAGIVVLLDGPGRREAAHRSEESPFPLCAESEGACSRSSN